ncbi:MAG: bifunctional phosphoribosylaminoimidazolecarboxamide formyltransferase/IMP cyclohydrolase [Planctomycetes bacterium]|nr:bifunctional phosphoribosylaminoimidazolecarboxamide formyltransferase/IMP cyclohydrolase [Planctomycetota bacterium]
MSSKEIRIERALLSVFKKDGILDLARALARRGVEILSTGGTARMLREAGLEIVDVAEVTGFPEMMDGRVKTLHPRVHGGLLMRRDLAEHREAATRNGIRPIDLVVVNLYPFGEVIAKPEVDEAEAIEMIDIGGPTMIRSAAKNHEFVTVLTQPEDYADFVDAFEGQDGRTTHAQRRAWARKAFQTTAAYDAAIQDWMGAEFLPERLTVSFTRKQALRYGENPHQEAAAYLADRRPADAAVAWAEQLNGKELSFNNYLDADAAFECAKSLPDVSCAVIKHKNPCGAASHASSQSEAFLAAHAGDPVSAYGGIVAFNRPLERGTAELIATKDKFFEVIIAPSYEDGAIEVLQTGAKWGKNVRILATGPIGPRQDDGERELRWIRGGMLVETPDRSIPPELEPATSRVPDDRERQDLLFAWALCRHVTSNAIVFVKDRRLIGVGAGQMSRIDSVELAAKKGGALCDGAVMASDAFFPFADGILAAHAAGVRAVIQPGGSIRDQEVTKACDEAGIAMVLTGRRHFRH